MHRNHLPAKERQARSRICQIGHQDRLLRGSLTLRRHTCGKPSCHCARGEPHESLYLVQRRNGKLRQLFIPKTWESRVRQALDHFQELQALLDQLSELEWERLKNREE
jgi:hypothetical protein